MPGLLGAQAPSPPGLDLDKAGTLPGEVVVRGRGAVGVGLLGVQNPSSPGLGSDKDPPVPRDDDSLPGPSINLEADIQAPVVEGQRRKISFVDRGEDDDRWARATKDNEYFKYLGPMKEGTTHDDIKKRGVDLASKMNKEGYSISPTLRRP